jgi:hypothetical protein
MRRSHRLALGIFLFGVLSLGVLWFWTFRFAVHVPAPLLHFKGVSDEGHHDALNVFDQLLESWIQCKERQAALISKGKWSMQNKHLDLRDHSIVHEDPLEEQESVPTNTCEYQRSSSLHDRTDLHRCDDPGTVYVDEVGRVCSQNAWDKHTGCCSQKSARRAHSCLTCSSKDGCCKHESFCISCCMRKGGTATLEYCARACRITRKSYHKDRTVGLKQPQFPHCFEGKLSAPQTVDPDNLEEDEPEEETHHSQNGETHGPTGPVEYLNFDG